ncbi:zinc finger-containing ubiquitin peptidase 1 isoform X1 [Nilaparvata lugens]|uniref:zinc finger-containing ubiquitin peptidase 1 isoform X1 n=2 Tax=Nilaparvata lugens TaxID=108931 RepID=UPI00193D0D2E|nr:zinc finger-containing ubiquitin peptidase 1 isoform X1 [Nilaparvata lugens]
MGCGMAAKMPELNYSCEICGDDGLTDEEMRLHILLCHLKGATSCPFCDLENISPEEMLAHVNTAHLDYLTPEQEMLAFIDDEEVTSRQDSTSAWSSLPRKPYVNGVRNSNDNLNNNNNECCEVKAGCSEGAAGWGSPQRSQLALNLRSSASGSSSKPTLQKCPMCPYADESAALLEEHINRQHFDLTSPSFLADSPSTAFAAVYSCPLCAQTFQNSPDLELHVNIEHKDILSPAKGCQEAVMRVDKPSNESCPICCMSNFKSTDELAIHIEDHFNQKGISPITPDVSTDRLLAKEMEKRDKEARRLQEQHEFEQLRAQYGMDNEGNFREQSLTNMQRAVYSGELSVADYYERQSELRMAESSGVDDGSSCTKDIVPLVMAVSNSCSNVAQTFMCSTVDHYASTYGDRGWGCGYRNIQMMLSSLLQHTGYNEQLYRQWSVVGGGGLPSRSAMPSISRLQQHIEWAWRQGFDLQGCDQLGGQLYNTRKWIGATELVTVLSSLRIRCQLVDFHRPTSPNGSHPELFNWVLEYFQANDDFKPPLYLQHQGHSRTIVGCEQLKEGGGGPLLLVLDPSHSPHQMLELRNTATALAAMRLIRKSLHAMKARHYQVVAVAGIMDTEAEYQQSKVLRSVRIPQER